VRLDIDTDELGKLVQDADKILLEPEAEETLLRLLDIERQITEAIKAAKVKLEETALSINPNFKAVVGEKITVGYQYFGGQRYAVDETLIAKIPSGIVKEVVKHEVDIDALEDYEKSHGQLPYGIIAKDRKKAISFRLKKEKDAVAQDAEPVQV